MKNTRSAHHKKLLETAISLTEQGFSVIPVHGDNNPKQPKKPATQWKQFQKRLAEPHEITSWFTQDITAIGIVCGQVSKLFVVDFDDYFTYAKFCKDLPSFAQTFTVKTQRGYHLYFQTHQRIASHHFKGGDIKAEKSYIIAPPSIIDGHQYKIINSPDSYQTLFPSQVDKLLNYFQVEAGSQSNQSITRITAPPDLIRHYDILMPQIGRNNALYRTASIARDYGISQLQAEKTLIYHHVKQPPPRKHKSETPQERYREAERTIRSAFSTSPKIVSPSSGIPNSIREALLRESTVVARLLDIFHLAGWKPKDVFTLSNAIELCQKLWA